MASTSNLLGRSLAEFVDRVAEPTSTPAAGSASAAVGALGAALISMAFRVSCGENPSGTGVYVRGRSDELDALRLRLLQLADEDAEAYAKVGHARRRMLDGAEDGAAALRKAMLEATEVPLEIQETAVAALRIAAAGAGDVGSRLRPECTVGAQALRAVAEGVESIVVANLEVLEDEAQTADRLPATRQLRTQALELSAEVARQLESA